MSGGNKEFKDEGKSFGILVSDKKRQYMMDALLEQGERK
jgi:hypothetical protein